MTSLDPATPIYEEGEVCDVCGGIENLGSWGFPKDHPAMATLDPDEEPHLWTVCASCFDDKETFLNWLAKEFEDALASNPDEWERLPNGKWRDKTKSI